MSPVERAGASELLGPTGPLSERLAGYEERDGQLAMAQAVERALADATIVLCEAGTGTGKTLAYLVPALASGQRVVVSTATRALQDQIASVDLPTARALVRSQGEVAVAKGLSNYLCLRRFGELRRDPAAVREHRRSLPLVEAWAKETQTGDVSELTALTEDDPIWPEVTSSSETRVGGSCPHYDACFVTRMKQTLARASLIITNHHLFLADVALKSQAGDAGFRAGVLPPYEAVIFDEAHRLEDIAAELFGLRISSAKVAALSRDATRTFRQSGLTDPLLVRGDAAGLLTEVDAASAAFFGAVSQLAEGEDTRTLLTRDRHVELRTDAYARLDTALEAIASFAETHATSDALHVVARRAAALRDDLASLVDPPTAHALWVSRKRRSVILGAAAVSVGATLRGQVFDRTGGVVLTSATLTSVPVAGAADRPASPFSFVRQRLGLEEGLGVKVEELEVGSPFAYDACTLLYVARDLPEPTSAAFSDAALERASELIEVTGGGAFVLTTSVRALKAYGARLARTTGREVLVQGEAPKSALIARFRKHGDAVLVGTMSFWEGVDVAGHALRLVIIDKLPFAVPSDPVVSARCAALEASGQDPFLSYSVPSAAITLKQGAGRLIRTRKDVGVVAVLDRRVVTRRYGQLMLERLPMKRRTEHLGDVRAFWETVSPPTSSPRGG
ncbi:MAG: ATP-dependent DNA helicase [Myxococcales bacterium]|nr:ATP-dependent DNA helicase [Myxococcales bacterium]